MDKDYKDKQSKHYVKVLYDVNNTVIANRWKVIKRIAEGSFDSLYYEVIDQENKPKVCTIKVESNLPKQPKQPPHFFPEELDLWRALKALKTKSFPVYEGDGQSGQVRFFVLEALGKDMDQVRRQMPRQRFALRTVIHVAKEVLACLEDIHTIRFLHRDVKPHNMVLGRPPKNQRRIYLVNFELSRKYVDEKGDLLLPRSRTLYRGSPRYSSVGALKHQEQGRADDMWAWFFSILELTFGKMPIKDDNGPIDTVKFIPWLAMVKQKGVDVPDLYLGHGPKEYYKLFSYINSLKFHDKPDYALCGKILDDMAIAKGYMDNTPLDWEANPTVKSFVG